MLEMILYAVGFFLRYIVDTISFFNMQIHVVKQEIHSCKCRRNQINYKYIWI